MTTTPPDPAHDSSATPLDDVVRPHTYDGIQEYDKRMPRWWLVTLYGSMLFAAVYWGYYHAYSVGQMPEQALSAEMADNAAQAARKSGVINDEVLWRMSLDPQVLAAGKTTFDTTCAACHKPDLTGLIGPNLVDQQWIHGGKPMESMKTIDEGVLTKGMPAWGALLGKQKITEVTAYIFSHHKPGEEVVAVPGWTPPGVAPVPTP